MMTNKELKPKCDRVVFDIVDVVVKKPIVDLRENRKWIINIE